MGELKEWEVCRRLISVPESLRIILNNRKCLCDPDVMMSFFPKEIIQTNFNRKTYDNICFMSLKVSGVVEYSEICDRMGLNNPSEFMKTLKDYFDPIITAICAQSGDIIQFFPDEIWAIWKIVVPEENNENILLRNMIHEIINCAIHIRRIRDIYQLNGGIIFRMKIVISVGSLAINKIETDDKEHWVYFGGIFNEVKEALRVSLPGQILLSLSGRVQLMDYYYQTEEYGKYVKILGVGPNWKEKVVDSYALIDGQFILNESSSEETIFNSFNIENNKKEKKYMFTLSDSNRLRKSLPQPLIKTLDLCKSMEYNSKIQAIAVLHIKIDMTKFLSEDNLDSLEIIMRTLCSIIYERKGYLHKTKIYKTSIQTIFIFGNNDQIIRVNCREAMNNAMGSFIAFGKLKEVEKISVAVTCGLCYSGILNNSDRRTYMVISPSLKIASRLSKLYPGKIVCDKKAILHSAINETQFVLLEYQSMRSYEPGPVYEYIGKMSWKTDISQEINYPLIGNEEKLSVLLKVFEEFERNFKKKILGKYISEEEPFGAFIIGEEGRGKTRILKEFCWRLQYENLIKFEMQQEHETVPYHTIKTIFDSVPEFRVCKTKELKKAKLGELFKSCYFSDFLCFFNVVFETDFNINEIFLTSSEEEKVIVLEQMFRRLGYMFFKTPHLLVIDNAEYVDKTSSNILYEFLENKICFLLLTFNSSHHLSIENERLIKHKNALKINLEKMEENQQAALICQILNVNAISTILEKHIREVGNGNPKKIEEILFDMIQNNEVLLKIMNYTEMKSQSLCVPSFHLTKRIPSKERFSISSQYSMMEESEIGDQEKSDTPSRDRIPVCLVTPFFRKQSTNDRKKLSDQFECLSSDQKFVLQAASILSETFPRSMLIYVMNLKNKDKTEMEIAEAIQGLFELGILCCAKSRFSEREKIISKRKNVDVSDKCDCLDLTMSELCEPIPKYSFCQFMKFGSISFREVVREDVSPQTASELHTRSLKFLSRETRRCNACGNGLMDIEAYRSENVVNVDLNSNMDLNDFFKRTEEQLVDVAPIRQYDENLDIYRQYYPFSKNNYSKCECEMILCSVFKQMVEHHKELDQFLEMLKCIIDYAEICFVLKYYEKALALLEYGLKTVQTFESLPNKDLNEATFFTLIGKAHLKLYHRDEAVLNFFKTLEILGEAFPSSSMGTMLKLYSLRLRKSKNFYNCLIKKSETLHYITVSKILANALSGLFRIFKCRKDWKKAELCAIWALSKSIVKKAEFSLILECITNMIVLGMHQHNPTICRTFESYGLHIIRRRNAGINRRNLSFVLRFYKKCFIFRLHQNKMGQAKHLENLIVQMAVDIDSMENILSIIPFIVIDLLFSEKLSEVFSLIRKIEFYATDMKNSEGSEWFYICNMITLLETGYSLTTINECEGNLLLKNSRKSNKYKLIILLWLWYIRNEEWLKSFDIFVELRELFGFLLSSEHMGLWVLYVFEGVLSYLAQRTKNRDILSDYNVEEDIIQICRKIENMNVAQIYTPRHLHLRAYYELIKNDERSNNIFLEKAVSTANENKNFLEINWIEHSKRVWFNNLPDFLKDAWRENSSKTPSEYDSNDKILHFTLIIPIH